MYNRNVWTGILILAILCIAFFLKPAHGDINVGLLSTSKVSHSN